MNIVRRGCRFIRDCVELYIPMISFVVLFLVFCFQVFMRYVVNAPQSWTSEVEQACFLWLVLLGACYAQREKGHVTFTLLYDALPVKGKAITAMLGNLIITFTFLMATIPSLNYILGMMQRNQLTSILKIPKTYIFLPFVIFLVVIVAYTVVEIYEQIMVLRGDQRYIQKMLRENKSEAELAIENAADLEPLNLNLDFSTLDQKGGTDQ